VTQPNAHVSARLRPYVAGLAVEWLRSTPQARHRRVEGSLAFVDISGFTALTERLAARGKVGAEELSDLLDATFVTLLEQAYGYGASLVKWGGDAVLLLFEGPEHARLACRAAFELRRTMRRVGRLRTSVGVVQLRMSVGISSGVFDFFLVGQRHRELLVTGPAASTAAEMEQTAEAGQVVISGATASLLQPRCVGAPAGNGLLLRAAPDVDPRSRCWPRAPGIDLSTLLDPSLAEHLRLDVGDSEHRQAAIGFLEVSGVDDLITRQGPAAVSIALQELLSSVQDACERHRVTFWESDISRDGFKVMLVAGAPRSSGHDEEALLRAARAILDAHSGSLHVRIGVNCGRVFTGAFGPAFRRTWSAKGDAVNLAARVMGKAGDGELLATSAVLDRVRAEVDAMPVPPFTVKGKQHPVSASRVRAVAAGHGQPATAQGPFAGRTEQLAALGELIAGVATGRGSAVAVTGEAGIGKSRLVEQAVAAVRPSVEVVRANADSYENTPYAVVRRLVRTVLGVAPDAVDGVVILTLHARLRKDDRLLRWLPLLGTALGVVVEDSAETAAVQDEFRRDRVAALVVELLGRLLIAPTVLFVDDVQDADTASVHILAQLSMADFDTCLIVLAGQTLPGALSHVRQLHLAPLSPTESSSLVLSCGGMGFAPHLLRSVVDRADGNPHFLCELTAAAAQHNGELPDSLEELLTGRIDDLDPQRRSLLRACSVLGVGFAADVLEEVLGEAVDEVAWSLVEPFVTADSAGRRRFRSGLLRDAAYEGLPYRRRVELHGRAAAAFERVLEGGWDPEVVAALSAHCLSAGLFREAWEYSLAAGRQAQQLYANTEALTFYDRALAAARRLPDLDPSQVAELMEATGDVHARLAELEPAMGAYREARKKAPKDEALLRARVAMSAGVVATRSGQSARALRWLGLAYREASLLRLEDAAFGALAARANVERAYLRHMAGRVAEATRLCDQAIAEAEPLGAVVVVGRALLLQDMIAVWSGREGDEARVLRALSLFEQGHDLPREAGAWNHLGITAYFRGEWDLALQRYRAALAAHERAGDDWSAALVTANIAEILLDQGRLDDAEPLAAEALRVWRATTPSDIGFGAALMGRIAARRGRFDEALVLFDEAKVAYAAMDERVELVAVELAAAEALLLQGAAVAASGALERIIAELLATQSARTASVGDHDVPLTPQGVTALRLQGCAAKQLAQDVVATTLLQCSVDLARTLRSPQQIALSLRALEWARGTAPDWRSEAGALLASLGVVAVPELPLRAARPALVVLPSQARSEDALHRAR
jgi:class 3 adenylate cyclase/tetratricopeptide (TPR) repeat protein